MTTEEARLEEKFEQEVKTEQQSELVDPLPNFMPIWTEVFNLMQEAKSQDHRKWAEERGVQYTDADRCLVAEGNNFKKKGGWRDCSTCDRWDLSKAQEALYGTRKDFYQFKQELYDHIQKEHSL